MNELERVLTRVKFSASNFEKRLFLSNSREVGKKSFFFPNLDSAGRWSFKSAVGELVRAPRTEVVKSVTLGLRGA